MNNKTKELGLVLTGADEAEKTFQQFRLELSGNTGNSNMEIIDKAFGELVTLIGNKKVHIRAVDGYVQYSEDDQTWHNIIALSELKGAKGDSGVHMGSDAPPAGTKVWVNPSGKRTGRLPNPFNLILRGLAEGDVLYDGSEEVIVDFGNLPDVPESDSSAAPPAPMQLYMRVSDGYIQYSEDGVLWENVIAVDDLRGDDYNLTDADKAEIAARVVDLLPKYGGEVEEA